MVLTVGQVGGRPADAPQLAVRQEGRMPPRHPEREVPRHLLERRATSAAKLGDGEVHQRYWIGPPQLSVQPPVLCQAVSPFISLRFRPLISGFRFELLLRFKANYLWPGEFTS